MCSNYQSQTGDLILPYTEAPVVTANGTETMHFSMIPSWSETKRPKFATHNARLETVDQKATWKRPFLKQHAYIQMGSFIEPIYTGELAGNMVAFQSNEPLYAAAVFDEWRERGTNQQVVRSFAILTSEPCAYVKGIGHDRQPIFLALEDARTWLTLQGTFEELKGFLRERSLTPPFFTKIARPLRPGWERRVKPPLASKSSSNGELELHFGDRSTPRR